MSRVITARESYKIRREYVELAEQVKLNPSLQQKTCFMEELKHRRERVGTMLKAMTIQKQGGN